MSGQARVQTPEFRVSYAKIWQPSDKDGEKRWELVAIWEADADFTAMLGLLKAAKDKAFGVGYGGPCRQAFKTDATRDAHDIQNGVDPHSDFGWRKKNPEYVGKVVANLSSKRQAVIPNHIVNNEVAPIVDQSLFYSGCYAVAMVTAFGYGGANKRDKQGNAIAAGVSFGLSTLLKTRDGEPLVAVYNAAEDFKGLAADPKYNANQNAAMFPTGTAPQPPALGNLGV